MPFVIAFCIAVVVTPLAGAVGRAVGLVDRPGALKIHKDATPLTGGGAVVAACLTATLLVGNAPPAFVVVAVLVALALGAVDDRRPLSPWVRLVGQAVAGLGLAASLPPVASRPLLAAVAVVLVPACANAVNLIDGQDGLAGGLAATAAVGLGAILVGKGEAASLQLALGGAAIGFVVWNRPPARIFLGNSGAYAVGAVLAAGAVSAVAARGWGALLGAGLCLGLFAFEVCFSVFRRLREGGAITSGDRFHSYDLLARRHLRTAVTICFWLVGTALSATAALTASSALFARAAVVVACTLGVAAGRRLLWIRSQLKAESASDSEAAADLSRAERRAPVREAQP